MNNYLIFYFFVIFAVLFEDGVTCPQSEDTEDHDVSDCCSSVVANEISHFHLASMQNLNGKDYGAMRMKFLDYNRALIFKQLGLKPCDEEDDSVMSINYAEIERVERDDKKVTLIYKPSILQFRFDEEVDKFVDELNKVVKAQEADAAESTSSAT